ncbi:MAG TPA: protein kinase, partial [Gemmataceae bacterium]|nr:protein kinase [Gemmataceae bacterium]
MLVMMKCIAEAVMAKGVKGLAEVVPGGNYLFEVANEALKRMRERKRATELRAEVLQAAQATNEEAKRIAEQVAREVAASDPSEDRLALEMYLAQVPGVVRQSLKRADDPSGRSVPDGFALNDAADLMKRLPSRAAKFRPGDPLPGKPGWQLVELLGTGGFGEVWLARNPSLSALRGAVKFGLDPQARDRLLRHEGSLVNRVMEEGKHPNVVQLLDAHLEGDAPWLMYEYVPGGDLTGLIFAWQSLPPDERAKRATAALQTLAAAVGHFHRLRPPLVHRDLKPANILVNAEFGTRNAESKPPDDSGSELRIPNSAFRVTDFGIGGVAAAASLAENATRRSSTGYLASQLWGSHTPLYASPQQQRGDAPDPRDDVHALGVIGFQMLTGKLDATLGADYAKTLRRLNIPEPLIELLGDCAAHDLDNRPKDAAELAERLAKLSTPSPAPPVVEADKQLLQCPQCHSMLKVPKGEARPIRCTNCAFTFRPFVPPPAPPPAPVRTRLVAAPVVEPEPPPTLPKNLRGAKPAHTFRYEAMNADGEEVRGTVEAHDKQDAMVRVKNRGLFITKLTQVGGDRDDEPRPRRERPRGSGLGRGLLMTFGIIFLGCIGLPMVMFLFFARGGSDGPPSATPTTEREKTANEDPGERKVEKVTTITGVPGRTADVFFSPDAAMLATVSEDGHVVVWNVPTGGYIAAEGKFLNWERQTTIKGTRPAFNRAGSRFAVGDPAPGAPDRIDIFQVGITFNDGRAGLDDTPLKLAYSPAGGWLVAGGAKKGM